MNLAPLNPSATLNKLEHSFEDQQQKAKRKLKRFYKQQAKLARRVQSRAFSQSVSKQQICWGVTGLVGIFALGMGLAYLIKSQSTSPESEAEPDQKSRIIQQG